MYPFTNTKNSTKIANPLFAETCFGLIKNQFYTEFIKKLQDAQRVIYRTHSVHLSTQISKVDVVLHQQVESHIRLEFYAEKELTETPEKFKEAVTELCNLLAFYQLQKTLTIHFWDETQTYGESPEPPKVLPQIQEVQSLELFSQYKGELPLLLFQDHLSTEKYLLENLPQTIEIWDSKKVGIPVFQRAIQAGKAHPVIPALELDYEKPSPIAVYTKFLLSGKPISLEIYEVQGKVDLNDLKDANLLKTFRCPN